MKDFVLRQASVMSQVVSISSLSEFVHVELGDSVISFVVSLTFSTQMRMHDMIW